MKRYLLQIASLTLVFLYLAASSAFWIAVGFLAHRLLR